MSYESEVEKHRKLREDLIKGYQKAASEEETSFNYFPIDKKWKVPAEVIIRKPKEAMEDYKIKFKRIGKITFDLLDNNHKLFNLFKVDDDLKEEFYIYLKDGTTGKSSYGVGRFVKVLKEDDHFFVDFNLSFTPACGHIGATACPWARESSPVSIEAGEMYIPES